MELKELIKKLKAFDCEALRKKDVVHYFVSNGGYSYMENVTSVYFDGEKGRIVLLCDDPVQVLHGHKANITTEEERK
ncbi:MAG: hypothetical protein K5651_01860 [Bacteroidales bacterium]|nr:hypothetical protein [Bacteroidales bacterium]